MNESGATRSIARSWTLPQPPVQATRRDLLVTVVTLLLLLAWDSTNLDMTLALPLGTARGFPLQDNWFLAKVAHEGARRAAWLPAIWLIAGIWWPTGLLRRLTQAQRVEWVALLLLALGVVSLIKQHSLTSCPWDLSQFGGPAHWISHWALARDGGPGRCFPAGHSSAGFAYVSGYFVLRCSKARAARWWLIAALTAGFLFGVAQQLRGAHFMSHTFWAAWLCWTACWLGDLIAVRWVGRPGRS
jgi:membrane-associated PAP2 superfamily phosphatase